MEGTGEGQGAQRQDPQGGQGQQQGEASGGAPDLKQANARLNEENKGLKERIEQMQGQLSEFAKKLDAAKTADDVEAAVAAAKKEAEEAGAKSKAEYDARMKALAVQNALIQAGCVDATALMTHVDMGKVEVAGDGNVSGLDAVGLKESYPYLFKAADAPQTVSTGSAGSATPSGKPVGSIADGVAAAFRKGN